MRASERVQRENRGRSHEKWHFSPNFMNVMIKFGNKFVLSILWLPINCHRTELLSLMNGLYTIIIEFCADKYKKKTMHRLNRKRNGVKTESNRSDDNNFNSFHESLVFFFLMQIELNILWIMGPVMQWCKHRNWKFHEKPVANGGACSHFAWHSNHKCKMHQNFINERKKNRGNDANANCNSFSFNPISAVHIQCSASLRLWLIWLKLLKWFKY